jgi:hypothetical protein
MNKKLLVRRIWISLVLGMLVGAAISELSFWLLGETAREPGTVVVVIPPGTAELVAKGQKPPTLPEGMVFVVGDVLSIVNDDSSDHQLGPMWIPAGTSGRLVLGESESLAFDCSFLPAQKFDLDIHDSLTLSTRLYGIFYAGLPLGILIALYFVIMPEKKMAGK